MRILLLAAVTAALGGDPHMARGDQVFTSPATRVVLLELYTSEGCSSCPPAECWFARQFLSEDLWLRVVPVAFHVDYWARLGWPDRFAAPAHAQRQRAYASRWGAGSVYTPQFVLNGNAWAGWRRQGDRLPLANEAAGVLKLSWPSQAAPAAEFVPSQTSTEAVQVHVALLGFGLTSAVTAGENAGRTLTHESVVLAYASAAMHLSNGVYAATLALPLRPRVPAARRAAVAWVTADTHPPLQAVGGWLTDSPPTPMSE